MTNKFKAKKATVDTSVEQMKESLESMWADWCRRIDAFDRQACDMIDAMEKRSHGMAGIIDVLNAAATLGLEWKPLDCVGVATEYRLVLQGLKDDWANMPPTLETADTWLDKYVDHEFATKDFKDWEAVLEVCKMNMCQQIWEVISNALDFNLRAKDQMDELCQKIAEKSE